MEKNIRNTKIINKDEGIIWRPPLLPPVVCCFVDDTGLVVAADVFAVVPGAVLFFVVADVVIAFVVDFVVAFEVGLGEGLDVAVVGVGSALEQNVIIPSRQTVMTIDLFHILIAVFRFSNA